HTVTAPPASYTLSLHDALPISMASNITRESILELTRKQMREGRLALMRPVITSVEGRWVASTRCTPAARAFWARRQIFFSTSLLDRKSTRLNSSHVKISYAVFC